MFFLFNRTHFFYLYLFSGWASLIIGLFCSPLVAVVSDIERIAVYDSLSTQLAALSDQALSTLLEQVTHNNCKPGVGGGRVGTLDIGGKSVFFKTINLTDLERQAENDRSTKNIFGLPLYYQYGIGSAGFGAWRELFVHSMVTNWVLAGVCSHFPLLYHWRMLARQPQSPSLEELKDLNEAVNYWGGSSAVRTRLESIHKSSAVIVLFIEHIPYTLKCWFNNEINKGDCAAQQAVTMVEENINVVTSLMKEQGLIHFDAHFDNIMTDGHRLYFTDFGLALCSQFDLSESEYAFFKTHSKYDWYHNHAFFVAAIVAGLLKTNDFEIIAGELFNHVSGKEPKVKATWALPILKRYAPLFMIMSEFYKKLEEKNNK